MSVFRLCTLLLALGLASMGEAKELFGSVEAIDGVVELIDDTGKTSPLSAGQSIFEHQTIRTGADAEVHLATVDGGMVALRPGSSLRIDAYLAKGGEEDKMHIALLKGALRSITGWIGKLRKSAHKTTTSTATIGIRGTDFEAFDLDDSHGAQAGTYVTVHEGATVLRTEKSELDVGAGQHGFSPRLASGKLGLLADAPEMMKNRKLKLDGRIPSRKEQMHEVMEEIGAGKMQDLKDAFRDGSPEQRERMKNKVRRIQKKRNN
jgi:hypothetical protein